MFFESTSDHQDQIHFQWIVGIKESSWHRRITCFETTSVDFNPIWWFMLLYCFRLTQWTWISIFRICPVLLIFCLLRQSQADYQIYLHVLDVCDDNGVSLCKDFCCSCRRHRGRCWHRGHRWSRHGRFVCTWLVKLFDLNLNPGQHRSKHQTGTVQCPDCIEQYLGAASNGEALIEPQNAAYSGLWAVQ
jgi:hypothetical protein